MKALMPFDLATLIWNEGYESESIMVCLDFLNVLLDFVLIILL